MRWICEDQIEECLTAAWRSASTDALDAIKAAPDAKARKVILKKVGSSKIWRDFYDLLPADLKKKCWYCESADVRADTPVDHFRPKGEVEENVAHEGYWWLAFDWKNYRCACTFCNSKRNFEDTQGGKGSRFPLQNEHYRAFTPNDDLELEKPALLDPFDTDDCKSLWFDNDGLPQPSENIDAYQELKVVNSIQIFHLHETKISQKRKNIFIEITKQIRDLERAKKNSDLATIKDIKKKLSRMVKESEEFSRAATVYLRPYRLVPEVKEILNRD